MQNQYFIISKKDDLKVEIIDNIYNYDEAIEKALELGRKNIKSKLNDEEYIIYEKCLKVSLNDSKIELEVFYAVCENITGYERIDINDQRCRKKCNGSNMANDSNNISNTNYLQNNISSSKP